MKFLREESWISLTLDLAVHKKLNPVFISGLCVFVDGAAAVAVAVVVLVVSGSSIKNYYYYDSLSQVHFHNGLLLTNT